MELTNDNYFSPEANLAYLDCSTYKNFVGTAGMKGCETRALAIAKGEYIRPMTDALLIGSYVDAYFEGTLEEFKEKNKELIYTKSSIKSGKYELFATLKQAEVMIERAERDPMFMEFMEGEKQKIVKGHIGGVPVRAKLDVFNGERIVDLKTCASMSKSFYSADLEYRLSFIEQYGYIEQAAFYTAIMHELEGKWFPFYLACITKETTDKVPHPRLGIIQIPNEVIQDKIVEIEEKIWKVWSLLQGDIEPVPCGTCEHCADTLPIDHIIQLDQLLYEV